MRLLARLIGLIVVIVSAIYSAISWSSALWQSNLSRIDAIEISITVISASIFLVVALAERMMGIAGREEDDNEMDCDLQDA